MVDEIIQKSKKLVSNFRDILNDTDIQYVCKEKQSKYILIVLMQIW